MVDWEEHVQKMSLNKAIAHGKEKRKPYTGSKAFSHRCRNHGGCDFCEWNRLYQTNKELERMEEQKDDYQQEEVQGRN